MLSTSYEQVIHEDTEFPIIFHNDKLSMDGVFLTHWHECIEILHFREGSGTVFCDTIPFHASEGQTVIVNTGTLHTIKSLTPVINYDCLLVDKLFLEQSGLPVEEGRLLSPLKDDRIRKHFDQITQEVSNRDPYYKIAVKSEVLSLFAHIYRTASQQQIPAGESASRRLNMIRSAISYIRQHYEEDLTIDDICRHVGFSKYYFCREFRKVTGKTVTDTINFLRCSHAKSLLASGRWNVSESAEQSGFHNLSYFSKVYKRYTGVLPSETERQN